MADQITLLDNGGHVVPPDPAMAHPVAASGITLTTTAAGDDYTQTVEQGQLYAITYVATAGSVMFASITGATSTAANIEWVFMANEEYIVHIPIGSTVLYYEGDDAGAKAYLRKVAS